MAAQPLCVTVLKELTVCAGREPTRWGCLLKKPGAATLLARVGWETQDYRIRDLWATVKARLWRQIFEASLQIKLSNWVALCLCADKSMIKSKITRFSKSPLSLSSSCSFCSAGRTHSRGTPPTKLSVHWTLYLLGYVTWDRSHLSTNLPLTRQSGWQHVTRHTRVALESDWLNYGWCVFMALLSVLFLNDWKSGGKGSWQTHALGLRYLLPPSPLQACSWDFPAQWLTPSFLLGRTQFDLGVLQF